MDACPAAVAASLVRFLSASANENKNTKQTCISGFELTRFFLSFNFLNDGFNLGKVKVLPNNVRVIAIMDI